MSMTIARNGLNILIVGEGALASEILESKYTKKLYITSPKKIPNVSNIQFNTFRELAQKCKTIQIDLVIAEDEKYILEGIADVLKSNFVNCVAFNTIYTKLKTDTAFAKKLLKENNINYAKNINLPSKFPVLIKSGNIKRTANSLQEIVEIKKEIFELSPELAKDIVVEQYINGDKYNILSLYDGKHVLTLPSEKMTASQVEKLEEYNGKLKSLLNTQRPDTGFIVSELVWDNDWYNVGFNFDFKKINKRIDIVTVLEYTLYQKLNEFTQ